MITTRLSEHPDPEVRRLVRHLRAVGQPQWADRYFELGRLLLSRLRLESGDPRLTISAPKSTARWLLPVTFNNRYVLAVLKEGETCSVGFICDPGVEHRADLLPLLVRIGFYDPQRGESPFAVPRFAYVADPEVLLGAPALQAEWLAAARYELERVSASSFRRFHSDFAYRAVTDPALRATLLASAFDG